MDAFEISLKNKGEREGFKIFWDNPEKGFILVKGIELETKAEKTSLGGKNFPIRLVVLKESFLNRFQVKVKIEVRSIPVWDTGETEVITKLGHMLLREEMPPR